jgi:uroporphyrinogen decarboxylase-like protein
MINIEASVSKGWLHTNGGFIFDTKYYLDPVYRWEQDSKINKFISDALPRYAIYNFEANLPQSKFVKANHVLVGAIQPNMILATLLGAEFSFFEDKDADVKGRPLEFISNKDELPSTDTILEHPLVKDLERQIKEIQENRPDLKVIPPFFWDESGRSTIHGIVTTSLKLTGDNIMIIMMSDPDLAHAIHQWIVDAYVILIHHFAKVGNLPVTSVHVGECAGTMISSELFEEFIVPYINQLGDKLGEVRLHSCGISDHLYDAMSHINNLKVIDTGSGSSVRKIRDLMGPDFVIHIAPPMEMMMEGSPKKDILDWLDTSIEENQGGPLQIAYHIEPDYEMQNCLVMHDELERRGLITNERLF